MGDERKNDWTDLLAPFRLFNFWNTSWFGNGWFGKLFRFTCNLVILTVVVNLVGGIALSMLIDWTEAPCLPSGDDSSLELNNDAFKVQLEDWNNRKQYWLDTYHVNLEDVNRGCRDFNENWTNTNLYLKEKAFQLWNKIDWTPVQRCVRSVLGVINQVSPEEEPTTNSFDGL
ncbi:MAG: hypothetical protein IKX40_11580 [Thermoguttaceae bacterium]|nr:hypothetical protein [Thermoguttaceae bacterium]